VLFQVRVTRRRLRQLIVALALMCRSSYLGIIEFMRDVLGWPISIGTIHNVLHAAAVQAGAISGAQDLSRIRTGLHDELFHSEKPVLAGVCAASTYCYLLAAEERRDAMARTPRSSSLVENLNSRLRNYFTLRCHLGSSYLDLLRFFLNHRRYMRSHLPNASARAREN
jgi:hypothetical protein